MTTVYYTSRGETICLGQELDRGGEGAILEIQGQPTACAKVYSNKMPNEYHRKLLLMVNNPPADPALKQKHKHRSIAWPEKVLYTDKGQQDFIGFTMPKFDGKQFKKALNYLDPGDRLTQFKGAFTWVYLLTAGYNIASAVAAIHEKGYCIGDFNESNVVIAPSTLITLLDCDSFQVSDSRQGKTYRCPVGKPEYTAPELVGKSLRDQDRTVATDSFALAVMLFQLLMEGTHPYAAKGMLVADAPNTAAKIAKGYFPYGAKVQGVAPPDHAPPFDILAPEIQQLFLRCFGEGHRAPDRRPTAHEWFQVLRPLRKKFHTCRVNLHHQFLAHIAVGDCPWCALKQKWGKDLYPSPVGQQAALTPPPSYSFSSSGSGNTSKPAPVLSAPASPSPSVSRITTPPPGASSLLVSCPSCNCQLRVLAHFLGQNVRCPACSTIFTVQSAAQTPPLVVKSQPKTRRRRDDDDDDDDDYSTRPRRRSDAYSQPKPTQRTPNKIGRLSLMLALPALLVSWIPCVGYLTIPVSVVALVLAAVGAMVALKDGRQGFILPIAGACTSLVAFVLPFISFAIFANLIPRPPVPVTQPVEDISGRWVGNLTQGYQTFSFEMTLKQTGKNVTGTARVADTSNPKLYAVWDLHGTTNGLTMQFEEDKTRELFGQWLPIKGTVTVMTSKEKSLGLVGPWQSVKPGYSGQVTIWKESVNQPNSSSVTKTGTPNPQTSNPQPNGSSSGNIAGGLLGGLACGVLPFLLLLLMVAFATGLIFPPRTRCTACGGRSTAKLICKHTSGVINREESGYNSSRGHYRHRSQTRIISKEYRCEKCGAGWYAPPKEELKTGFFLFDLPIIMVVAFRDGLFRVKNK